MRPQKSRKIAFWNKPEKAAYFFIAPSLLILTVFVFIPLILALALGFTKIDLFLKGVRFAGFDNFVNAFTDGRVWNAFKNTFYFTLMATPLQVFFGLLIACMVAGAKRFDKLMRSIYFIPAVCSMTVVGIMCSLVLDPNIGMVPYYIFKLGFDKPMMLKDPSLAMPTIVLITVWKNFGYMMIILVAGISGISNTYYEASEIDGASRIQQFFAVTIPLLLPSLSFCLVTNLISSFQVFDQVYVTTNGGPMYRTETVVQYIYSRGFSGEYNLGYASSIAFMLFAVIVLFTLLLNRWLRAREEKIY